MTDLDAGLVVRGVTVRAARSPLFPPTTATAWASSRLTGSPTRRWNCSPRAVSRRSRSGSGGPSRTRTSTRSAGSGLPSATR